ncbi:MAG: hypothetical protein K2X32_00900, partial [Phycisphaerales bacterium]|nr:hypothetical protein [Phycisphaerales bacterium]
MTTLSPLPRVNDPITGTGPRTLSAPRGPAALTRICKSWQAEAAMRMLLNNLDPSVAERPEDLV